MGSMQQAERACARARTSHPGRTAAAWLAALAAALLALACDPLLPPPRASSPRVPILMYHHVGDWGAPGDWAPWVVKPVDFEAQLDWLVAHGYHAITMSRLLAHRERGEPLPARPVMITFDDGWGEHAWIARQFLEPRGLAGVFFVYTGAVGAPAYLRWEDLHALESMGHEVLSHTVSHPTLTELSDARLSSEMRDSRARLESELGHPVPCIAYPFGACDGRVRQAAADAGYRLGVLADGGHARVDAPALELPRWKMAYDEPLTLFVQRLGAP